MIRAVISDFGGVLTSPLAEGFLAYQEETGVSPADLGMAMGKAMDEHGEHPLFELERGHISEAEFARPHRGAPRARLRPRAPARLLLRADAARTRR